MCLHKFMRIINAYPKAEKKIQKFEHSCENSTHKKWQIKKSKSIDMYTIVEYLSELLM